jgi:hypothetical protein
MSSGILVSKEMNIDEPTEVIMEYLNSDNRFAMNKPTNAVDDIQRPITVKTCATNERYNRNIYSISMNYLLYI